MADHPQSVDIVSFFFFLALLFIIYTQINSKGNVPGDIWIVEASSNLHFDRSLLTGERLVIFLHIFNFCFFFFFFFALLYSHLLQDQVV